VVPGFEVVVVDEELVVPLFEPVLVEVVVGVPLLDEDEELPVAVREVFVVEEVVADVVETVSDVDVGVCEEVDPRDVLPVDVVPPSDDEDEGPAWVETLLVALSVDGWRYTSAANVPAIKTRAIPAIRAMVDSLPATPADFLAGILSHDGGRARPSYARA